MSLTNCLASSVGTGMQAAILEGLYNGTGQPFLSCKSGNCTWSDLTTLGVCGGCDDISDQINVRCPGRTVENGGQYECDYAMPLNFTLTTWDEMLGGSGLTSQTLWDSTAASPTQSQIPFLALISVFEAVQLSANSTVEGLPPPKGSRCSFVFCTKTYSEVSMTNGVATMSISQEDALVVNQYSNSSQCPTCDKEYFFEMILNSSVQDAGTQSKYSVNVADFVNIGAYLDEMFSSGWNFLEQSTRNSTYPPTAPDVGRELANTQDLNQTTRAIAESMTESIRTSPNSTAQIGKAYIEKTFIQIRWGWLAFPIVLMVLTLFLLITVIVQPHRQDVTVWKSSSLAVLFHKSDGWDTTNNRASNILELDRMAKRMKGRLFDGGDHPAFIKED